MPCLWSSHGGRRMRREGLKKGSRINKLVWFDGCTDPEDLFTKLSICGHQGDGKDFWPYPPSVQRDFSATAVPGSSLVGDSRQLELPCLYFRWPNGGPPQPHFDGCSSTSRLEADAEAINPLRSGASRRPRPKWPVPDNGEAGQDVMRRARSRWRRTRWIFFQPFQGPCCKSVGLGCIFVLFLGLLVIHRWNECST